MADEQGCPLDKLSQKQIELLFDQTNVAIAATLVAAAVLIAILLNVSPRPALIGWSALFVVVSLARALLVRAHRRMGAAPESIGQRYRLFLVGAALSGVTWGLAPILLVPPGEPVYTGFAVLWVCGLSAGAVAALSVVRLAYFLFVGPALLPCAIYLLFSADPLRATIGGAALLFLSFVSLNALRMHRSLVRGLCLQIENSELITRLDSERDRVERLNERLERRVEERTKELARANRKLQQDISERHRIELELLAEKERAQVTLHSIGDAVITTDPEGRVDYLNPTAEQLTGWKAAQARGAPLAHVFRVVHESSREPVADPVARCLQVNDVVAMDNDALLISRDGQEFAVQDSAAPIRLENGEVRGAVLVFSDVTQARQMAMELTHQANHDNLTGLVNRRQFEHRLRRVIDTTRVSGGEHALCYLDLDQFKVINDTCGHVAGDELLRQLAEILSARVRKRDTLARLGGDEFGVLMEHCTLDQGRRVADSLRGSVRDFRFMWQDRTFNIGVSIGLVPITDASEGLIAVLRAADSACYAAKEAGRNRVRVYTEDDVALATRRGQMQWVSRIQWALEEDRFQLYYQPIINVDSGEPRIEYFEFLLRLKDDDSDCSLPQDLLPAAERYDLAVKIDCWVVRTAFQWMCENADAMSRVQTCFINISGQSLGDGTFLDFVADQFERTNVSPHRICFEITETAVVANLSSALRFIRAFRGRGCRFALDDFGSGLCSFAYLKNLPVDFIKIDGMFVRNISRDPVNLTIVSSINAVAKMMEMRTVAEWVEEAETISELRGLGVDLAQGNALGVPRPLAELPLNIAQEHSREEDHSESRASGVDRISSSFTPLAESGDPC